MENPGTVAVQQVKINHIYLVLPTFHINFPSRLIGAALPLNDLPFCIIVTIWVMSNCFVMNPKQTVSSEFSAHSQSRHFFFYWFSGRKSNRLLASTLIVCVSLSLPVCCINKALTLNEKPLQINIVISIINHPAGGGETVEIMSCRGTWNLK